MFGGLVLCCLKGSLERVYPGFIYEYLPILFSYHFYRDKIKGPTGYTTRATRRWLITHPLPTQALRAATSSN